MADNDLEYDDDTLATLVDLASQTKQKPSAGSCIAAEALRLALNRKAQRLIARGSSAIIIEVPDADWIDLIENAAGKLGEAVVIRKASERHVINKEPVPVGASSLRFLQQGRTVIFVSQDADTILDPGVLTATDLRIVIPPTTPALLRRVIKQVSGGIARGVTQEMAALPLSAIVSAIRPGITARDCVANLLRSIVLPIEEPKSSVPLLPKLPLTHDVRRWADDTLVDLHGVAASQLSADALIFGVLEGPPGVGKTLLVRSLAQTSGWDFVPTSVGAWFTSGDGALGGVARNLKNFMDQMLACEPAIGLLDELDALPDRATMDARGLEWWTPVITLFLTEIDRLRASGKRVLLLGATNYFDRLDAALVRSGRLQQRISVRAPESRDEIAALFRFHLGDDLGDTDLTLVAKLGQGATPAMVEGWVKSARAAARSAKRLLTVEDLQAQVLPTDDRTPADIHSIALHEAGHALVAYRLGHKVDLVSIVPAGSSAGHVSSQLQTIVPTISDVHDVVTVMLAGRAADIALGKGPSTGAMGDLEQATKILLAAQDKQGLGPSLLFGPAVSTRPDADSINAIKADLNALLARAIGMIETESSLAIKLASQLARNKILTGDELTALLGPVKPVSDLPEPTEDFGDLSEEASQWRV